MPDWTSSNDAALRTDYSYDHLQRITDITTVGVAEDGWMRHSLTRMYRSAFDRDPDQSGYGYWMPQFAQGLPMANIAHTFVNSTEFASVWAGYVDPADGSSHNVSTNEGFTQWAYRHILNGAPDAGGLAWWTDQLNTGAWTRGQMLTFFSDHASARSNPGIGGTDAKLAPKTVDPAAADIPQELSYTWDDAGNLTRLHESSQGVDQWQCFGYDNLHRLTSGYTRTTSSCSGFQGGGPFPYSVAYSYDDIGNITSASGTHTVSGGYTYGGGGAGPHAATAAGPHTYQYDNAGNQTVRSLNSGASVTNLTYDVLNRLVGTSGAGADLTALYDADGNRVKRTLDGTTTYYLGESYEIEISTPVDEATVGLYALNARTFNVSNDLASVGPDFVSGSYGTSGDIAVIGDWDGDGYDNAGVYRQSNNRFYFGGIPAASGSYPSVPYGVGSDQGLVGDWDGDGDDTIAVYRSSNSAFYFRNDLNAGPGEFATIFGITGDIPLVGDWTGDGIDSIGLYRPSEGTFYLRNEIYGSYVALVGVGTSGDKPIAGDWDGDGIDTVGFYRPSDSKYYLKNSNSGSGIDIITNSWGNGTSPPIAGNFNASIGHDGQQITINHSLAGVNIGSTINGEFYATATDHLGSTGVTRDEDAHTRIQRYTPYGAVRASSYNSNMPTDKSFTGQTTDPGLGLIDYNARHYDPQLGRFIQADTVLDGLNRYSYVNGNPLKYTDPTGHCSVISGDLWCSGSNYGRNGSGTSSNGGLVGSGVIGREQEVASRYARSELDVADYLDPFESRFASCAPGCPDPERTTGSSDPDQSGLGNFQLLYCLSRGIVQCSNGAEAAYRARDATRRNFVGEEANEGNAFQHAYWMALVASWNGEDSASWLGLLHEADKNDGPLDTERDLVNNEIGIRLAQVADARDLEALLLQASERGYLACTSGDRLVPCGG